jgi:hypothetical protein
VTAPVWASRGGSGGQGVAAPLGVVHQAIQSTAATPDGHLQGVQGEVGGRRPGGLPADQQAAAGLDDQGDQDEPDQVGT